jgi:hypothetical protein
MTSLYVKIHFISGKNYKNREESWAEKSKSWQCSKVLIAAEIKH